MSHCLGIDLGTSTTCVAIVQDGEPTVIPCAGAGNIIPSYIHLREDGKIMVGDQAKAEAIADPYNTIWATKRLLGRKFTDPGVQDCVDRLPYRIASAANGEILIQGRDKTFSPEWAASVILKFAVTQAAKYLKVPIKHAVIAVPGTFTENQRQALAQAAQKAGIEIMRLINEPTAAAMAWGFHKRVNRTIAIFDLGGGTLDVAVLKIGDGGYNLLASKGDPWLGGEDFDNVVVDRVVKDFLKKWRINIYADKIAHQRLKLAAENAKLRLSDYDAASICIPGICPDISRVADVDLELKREEFEAMVAPLVDRAIDLFKATVAEAGLAPGQLDNVLMVGGMTRVPLVRAKIEQAIGRPADYDINPDEAVAMGAAIVAAGMAGQKVALSPPPSTRTEDEYLSGNLDIHAMYDSVLEQKQKGGLDPGPAAPDWPPASNVPPPPPAVSSSSLTPQASSLIPSSPALRATTQMLLEVSSPAITPEVLARAFAVAAQQPGPILSGGIMIGPAQPEQLRIKIFQEGPSPGQRAMIGEFVVAGYQASPQDPPRICVYYNIDKQTPFALSATPAGRPQTPRDS